VLVDDGTTKRIEAILNNFQNDAFFMKTLGWCLCDLLMVILNLFMELNAKG